MVMVADRRDLIPQWWKKINAKSQRKIFERNAKAGNEPATYGDWIVPATKHTLRLLFSLKNVIYIVKFYNRLA